MTEDVMIVKRESIWRRLRVAHDGEQYSVVSPYWAVPAASKEHAHRMVELFEAAYEAGQADVRDDIRRALGLLPTFRAG